MIKRNNPQLYAMQVLKIGTHQFIEISCVFFGDRDQPAPRAGETPVCVKWSDVAQRNSAR